jgi:hypothetical protein
VKDARLEALQSLLRAQMDGFNKSCEARTMDVLFEKPGRKQNQAIGRSPYLQAGACRRCGAPDRPDRLGAHRGGHDQQSERRAPALKARPKITLIIAEPKWRATKTLALRC